MDDPTHGSALLLEFYILGFGRRPIIGNDESHLTSGPTAYPAQPLLRWMDFSMCPHCKANNRPWFLERLNENGPMISRSDGINFHLVLGDRPIEYPAEKRSGKSNKVSAGFWYLHEINGGTETVVVLLRKPSLGEGSLYLRLRVVADRLFDKLLVSPLLEQVYEFDGQRLHRI
jgi:hypothetical protein